MSFGRILVSAVVAVATLTAATPWKGKNPDPSRWTANDLEQILSNSPWSQTANAVFPDTRDDEPASVYSLPGAAQAGMAGPKGGTDGRWDGGVGKNSGRGQLPTLPVLVRWDSALPVRQALSHSDGSAVTSEPADYVLTVIGLVRAGRSQSPEGLMSNSRLRVAGRVPLLAQDVKIDADTGAVHLYFSRSTPIISENKEVVFTTRFGSLTVSKKFRLAEMTYRGRLEL